MLRKITASLLLATFSLSALATDYYVVVPLPGKAPGLSVSLAPFALPAGKLNRSYSFDMKPLVSVTGDTAYDQNKVIWSILSGSLPAGLTLGPDGRISGVPSAVTSGASFSAQAYYQAAVDDETYIIAVAEPQPGASVSAASGADTAFDGSLGKQSVTAGAAARYVFLRNTSDEGFLTSDIKLTSATGAFSIANVWATRDDNYNWSSANCQGAGNTLSGCKAPADGASQTGHKHLRVELRFDPSVVGGDTASLEFKHNGSTPSPITVGLTGEGTAPLPVAALSGVPGSDATPNGNLGQIATTSGAISRTYYLRNSSGQGILASDVKLTSATGAFTLGSVWATRDDDYNWSSANCLGAGNALTSCTANADGSNLSGHRHLKVEVRFDPSVVGTDSASLELKHNGSNTSPITLALSGEGIAPPPVVALSGVAGSTVAVNTNLGNVGTTAGSVSRWVYLRNVGTSGIIASDVKLTSATGAFSLGAVWATRDDEMNWSSPNCAGSGNALTSCKANADGSSGSGHKHLKVEVRFDPSVAGSDSATLELKHNGSAGSPATVTLTGEGYEPLPVATLSGASGSNTTPNGDFGTLPAASGSTTKWLFLRNTGGQGILKSDVKITGSTGAFTIVSVWATRDDDYNWSSPNCMGSGNALTACTANADGSAASGHRHLKVQVRFDPTIVGAETATLELKHNGSNASPTTLPLTGNGS